LMCRILGLGMASEKRNSDHATKYISRLGSFSMKSIYQTRCLPGDNSKQKN